MSIVEVAKVAGVSSATVSRLINNGPNVSPEKAERIRRAMTSMGYTPRARRPGPRARSRQGIRTGNVVLVTLSGLDPAHLLEMPALPQLLQGIQQELALQGLRLALDLVEPTGEVPSSLSPSHVDGVLILGKKDPMPPKLLAALRQLPVVWLLREHSDIHDEFDAVLYDNRRVGELAAVYLANRGHEKVAFLNADREHSGFLERGRVFTEVWQQRCGATPQMLEASRDEGVPVSVRVEKLVEQMLSGRKRPTGCFVASDDQMLGAIYALRAHGLRPGKDIELIGCNNDRPFISQMHPRPATIDIQLDAIGRRGVYQLLWRMRSFGDTDRARTLLSPVLVEGEHDTTST